MFIMFILKDKQKYTFFKCIHIYRSLRYFSVDTFVKQNYETVLSSKILKFIIVVVIPQTSELNCTSETAVRASYIVALKIAKSGRLFTDGQFVKECLLECSEVMCPSVVAQFEALSLSEQTISRRVQEIGAELKEQLRNKCRNFVAYSVALDESTDNHSIAQLAVFVRGVENDFSVTEELLDVISLKSTTTGEDMFLAVEEVFSDMQLSLECLYSVATDGAPAMLSEGVGFIGRM